MKAKLIFIFILFLPNLSFSKSESWVLGDIRVTGLQRVSAGSVFAVMPVNIGDLITEDLYKEIVVSILIFQTVLLRKKQYLRSNRGICLVVT